MAVICFAFAFRINDLSGKNPIIFFKWPSFKYKKYNFSLIKRP